ncbi:anti-sigma factor family protein [Lachnoclostridium phytofermentans]|jgi:hypothetical protein|uniref:anti-sigma factor family protein n=1 Tax=Lachnoclostridium phytofermentans TaxID=66219 RepID=UPI00054E432F|nr:zf-HC2 domain-containing protein [Lachnoclostridium phytofermentans]
MDCLNAQRLITPFIKDELSMTELEGFLAHVKECPECREELEVYYALLTAIKLLDEDKEMSNNFTEDLNLKIRNCEEHIRRNKLNKVKRRIEFVFVMIGVIIVSSLSIRKLSEIPVAPTKPPYVLRYSGIPRRYDPMFRIRTEYDTMAKEYVKKVKAGRLEFYRKNREEYEVVRPIFVRQREQKELEDKESSH